MSNDDLFPDDEVYTPPPLKLSAFEDMSDAERETIAQRWRKPTRRKGKAKTPENAVRAQIEKWLKRANILYRRYNAGNFVIDNGDGTSRTVNLGDPGTSDYLAEITIDINSVYIGVFCAIEAKAPRNGPTTLQAKFLNSVKARGGIAIVAYNAVDIENAINDYRQTLITRLQSALGAKIGP